MIDLAIALWLGTAIFIFIGVVAVLWTGLR